MSIMSLLNMVATLAVLLAVGFGSRRTGLIDDAFSKKLSKLVVSVGQPMLIISSIISIEYSAENLRRGLTTVALSFLLHLFMPLIAVFASKLTGKGEVRKISSFALVFTNAGFIGLPILGSIFGSDGLFCGAFYLIGFNMSVWTLGLLVLARGRSDIKLTPKKIFLNHGTVPCVVGFLLFILNVPIPTFLRQSAGYLAELCTPLSMMIAGALIATGKLREFFGNARVYAFSALKLILMPAVVCVFLKLIGLDDFYIVFGTVMAALPSASMTVILGEMYNIEPVYASRIVGMTTVLCTLTLPLAVLFATFVSSL